MTPHAHHDSLPVATERDQLSAHSGVVRMIIRRESLTQALGELENGTIVGSSTVVVSRRWWDGLTPKQRESFRLRASRARVDLRADDVMSSHFVEVRSSDSGPLSTERPM